MADIHPLINPVARRKRTPDGRAIHCCSTCGHRAPWDENWEWYGSYKDIDEGTPVAKFCSEKCKKMQRALTPEMIAEQAAKEYWPVQGKVGG